LQGDADVILDPGEAAALQDHARAAGKEDVEVVMVPGADHSFAGHHDEVIRAMTRFVDRVA
jgi:alpha/beta superfamily hydrolase